MSIKKLYLYVASLIGLILIIVGAVRLVDLGLKTWVFTKADESIYNVCERPRVVQPEGEKAVKPLSEEECAERNAQEQTSRRQRDAANSIAFLLVGAPVWYYHWNRVKEDKAD